MKKYYFISVLNSVDGTNGNPVRRSAKGNITWGVRGLMKRHDQTIKFDSLLEAHAFRLENLDGANEYEYRGAEMHSANIWEVCDGKLYAAQRPYIEIEGVSMGIYDWLAKINSAIDFADYLEKEKTKREIKNV